MPRYLRDTVLFILHPFTQVRRAVHPEQPRRGELSHQLILASTSRYRAMLLKRLGLDFTAVAPDVDERAVDLPPVELSQELAKQKALAVFQQYPNTVVIGSDQVPALDDLILTKPGTTERAAAQLEALSGRTHRLITSVCVASPAGVELHTDIHRLTLRPLTRRAIESYVQRDQPLDCAGAYKIESLGISLMQKIEGDDFTAITGLPLIATTQMLANAGISVLA